MKKVIILWFALSTASFGAYDSVAKDNFSTNDIYAFVYSWFANFDHQKDVNVFIKNLDPQKIAFQYPDASISSLDEFAQWYGKIENDIQYNQHLIKYLDIAKIDENKYTVTMVVNWQATTYKQANINLDIYQVWTIEISNKTIYLTTVKAKTLQ